MKNFVKSVFIFTLIFCVSIGSYAQAKKVKIDAIETIMNTKGDKILILNLWATFCKPCVEEIPSFVAFAKAHSNIEMVFVSLDLKEAYPKTVNKYIKKLKMEGINLWLDETDADYFVPKIDEKWSGALPATLMINTATGARKFFDDEMTAAELSEAYRSITN